MSAVVSATPFIRDKFLRANTNTVVVNNFPVAAEIAAGNADWSRKRNQVCYVGGITAIRGIREMVRAMELVESDVNLKLCGQFGTAAVEAEVKTYPGWQNVDELGWQERGAVLEILGQSVAGLVLFHPLPNHFDAQPNKMFEYMGAGVPIICSDFPLWQEIVEGNDCGICVDPLDEKSIAAAIDQLAQNPARAAQMGRNGQKAVRGRYNWMVEEKKLLDLYAKLLGWRVT